MDAARRGIWLLRSKRASAARSLTISPYPAELTHNKRLLAEDSYRVVCDESIAGSFSPILASTITETSFCGVRSGDAAHGGNSARPRRPRHRQRRSYTALRLGHDFRDRFMLKRPAVHLRLVLDQATAGHAARSAERRRASTDVELAKAMGFNACANTKRSSTPALPLLADSGPALGEKCPPPMRFTRTAIRRTIRELTERSSVITAIRASSVGFRTTIRGGFRSFRRFASTATRRRSLSPDEDARLDAAGHRNDGWESTATDIIGIHDYDGNRSTFFSATAPKPIRSSSRPSATGWAHPHARRLPAPRATCDAHGVRRIAY